MSIPQLQWWILFTIAVAGKNAKVTTQKINAFLEDEGHPLPAFAVVRLYVAYGKLMRQLKKYKLGKYNLLDKGFRAAIELDLWGVCAAPDNEALATLETVPGIGPKGARMILMYAFAHHADKWVPLDTHILRFLRNQGYAAPLATPNGKKYLYFEDCFRKEAKSRCMTMRELDTKIWLEYSGNKEAA